jgi:hypothetical protein
MNRRRTGVYDHDVEKTPRGRWFVDGFLVALYVVLVAVVAQELRPQIFPRYFPVSVPSPEGGWKVVPGTVDNIREYGGDNWTRSLPMLLTVMLLPMRRRRPLVVATCLGLAEVAVGTANASGDTRYALFLAADVVVLTIALHWRRRTSLRAAGLVLAGALVGTAAAPPRRS